MKKTIRVGSVLAGIGLCLFLVMISANIVKADSIAVTSQDELLDAVNTAGTDPRDIVIGADITLTSQVVIDGGKHITIKNDGSNRTIHTTLTDAFSITSGSSLTWGMEGGNEYSLQLDGTGSNSTSYHGSFIRVNDGSFTLQGGSIKNFVGNAAFFGIIKVYGTNGQFIMDGGYIKNNSVFNSVDGDNRNQYSAIIQLTDGGEMTMNNGIISGNKAYNKYQSTIAVMARNTTGSWQDGETRFTMNGGLIGTKEAYTNTANGNMSFSGTVHVGTYGSEIGTRRSKAEFVMNGGAIKGNSSVYAGGGVYVNGETLYHEEGIETNPKLYRNTTDPTYLAEFTMNGGEISNNIATKVGGGGIASFGWVKTVINDGTIANNAAPSGSGIATFDYFSKSINGWNVGGRDDFTLEEWYENYPNTFVMNGGKVQKNGMFKSKNGKVTLGGRAKTGGGIYIGSADATINAGEIVNNYAASQGGGIYVGNKFNTVKVNDALITVNRASDLGGGLWLCPTGDVEVEFNHGAAIFDNTAGTGNGAADGDTKAAGDDVVSLAKVGASNTSFADLLNTQLGGWQVHWFTDGGISPGDNMDYVGYADGSLRYDGDEPYRNDAGLIDGSRINQALKAKVAEEAKVAAQNQAKVIVTKNISARGGGVGSNGNVIFGNPNETYDTVNLKVTKDWKNTKDTDIPATMIFELYRYNLDDGMENSQKVDEFTLSKTYDYTDILNNLIVGRYKDGTKVASYGYYLHEKGETDGNIIITFQEGTSSEYKLSYDVVYKQSDNYTEVTKPDPNNATKTITEKQYEANISNTPKKEDPTPVKHQVVIEKINTDGEKLGNAVLVIRQNGEELERWTTEVERNSTINLLAGNYTLTEESAPDGYLPIADIYFTVKEDGSIVIANANGNWIKVNESTLTVTDQKKTEPTPVKHQVVIEKINTDGEKLGNAVLVIRQNGEELERWTTEAGRNNTINLLAGNYTLTEESAPDGYLPIADIYFTVKEDGSIVIANANGNWIKVNESTLTVTDQKKTEPTPVKHQVVIEKINTDGNLKKENENTFTVTDPTKPILQPIKHPVTIEKVNFKGEKLENAKLTLHQDGEVVDHWKTTTDDDHIIWLSLGDYTITEELAPDGYIAITEISFRVKEDGSIEIINSNGNTVRAKGSVLTVLDKVKPGENALSPKTGDSGNTLWIFTLFLSTSLLLLLIFRRYFLGEKKR